MTELFNLGTDRPTDIWMVNRRNAMSLRDTAMGRHRWKRLMISNGITRKWHHEKMTRYIKRHDPWNDITRKYHHDKMTQYIKRHDSWNDITWKWLSTWNDTGGSHHVTVLKIAFSECIHDVGLKQEQNMFINCEK